MSDGLREPLETVEKAIWDELMRQRNADVAFPPYVDRDGVIDGSVDMAAVAAAVVEALNLTEEELVLNEYAAANGATKQVQRRWVSGWSVVGGEPA